MVATWARILFILLLCSPQPIILTWNISCGLLNHKLQPTPESNDLQDGVEPPRGDAVVAVKGHTVVLVVDLLGQNDVAFLQDSDELGWLGDVCPLVELVGQPHEEQETQCEGEPEHGDARVVGPGGQHRIHRQDLQRLPNRNRIAHQKIVPVRLDPVMITHGLWCDMVFPEGADENPKDWGFTCPPSIATPMCQSADEVCHENGQDCSSEYLHAQISNIRSCECGILCPQVHGKPNGIIDE
mmetsp:Transcript_58288/g.104039  ORF Transcript_58288/g.104039 Transcript_58288/m.104039 type:complete len:241 (-) Transcript_58288:192-914(-)